MTATVNAGTEELVWSVWIEQFTINITIFSVYFTLMSPYGHVWACYIYLIIIPLSRHRVLSTKPMIIGDKCWHVRVSDILLKLYIHQVQHNKPDVARRYATNVSLTSAAGFSLLISMDITLKCFTNKTDGRQRKDEYIWAKFHCCYHIYAGHTSNTSNYC